MTKEEIRHIFENLDTVSVKDKEVREGNINFYIKYGNEMINKLNRGFLESKKSFHDRQKEKFLKSISFSGVFHYQCGAHNRHYGDYDYRQGTFEMERDYNLNDYFEGHKRDDERFEEIRTWLFYILKFTQSMTPYFLKYNVNSIVSVLGSETKIPQFIIFIKKDGINQLKFLGK